MKKPFTTMHARTFSHATENLDKVRAAIENTVGKFEIMVSRTEGHHGNSITILETSLDEIKGINEFFLRLSPQDIKELLGSLGSRVDDGCNLFLRIDKQSAFLGDIRLARSDDVISVRLRVGAFPARCEVARSIVKDYLEELLSGRRWSRGRNLEDHNLLFQQASASNRGNAGVAKPGQRRKA